MDIFRVQSREMSADVVEKNVGTAKKPKWTVCLIPTGGRFDNMAHELCDFLNQQENELNLNC